MSTRRILYFLTATLVLLFFSFAAQGEGRPFITRWKGEAGKQLRIPIVGENYKLVIKKADGTVLKTESSITTSYPPYTFTPTENCELLVEAGPEGITAYPTRESIGKLVPGSAKSLLRVEQFGTVAWTELCFQDCKNMQFATGIDTPDLSNLTDMCNKETSISTPILPISLPVFRYT